MKLATLRTGDRDGRLILVNRNLTRATDASDIAPTLLAAVESWPLVEHRLRQRADALQKEEVPAFDFDPHACMAPLPRTFQWCDGSAFLHHSRLMEKAFKRAPPEGFETIPLLYQGGSDDFLGPHDEVPLPDEAHGIDFEGEFVVVTGHVPMGCDPTQALEQVILIGQANDWSLRSLIPREMSSGFGFFQGKPSTSFAPVFLTPDELGPDWRHGRVNLDLHVTWNGQWFGHPNGEAMHFHFGQIISHAAKTRRLTAGTIIGSGTVSNDKPGVGSACISERRVLEVIEAGSATTGFMKFGDSVRMEARTASGFAPFGAIEQRVIQAAAGR